MFFNLSVQFKKLANQFNHLITLENQKTIFPCSFNNAQLVYKFDRVNLPK